MIKSLKYPSLSVKLKAMYSNKLNEQDFMGLMKQSSLSSAISYLKLKFSQLEEVNDNIDRLSLEQKLDNIFISDVLKLEKYLNKDEIDLLNSYLLRYEIRYVKVVFKKIITGKKLVKSSDNIFNTLFVDLNDIKNIEEFYNKIQEKKYYKIFELYKKNENIPIEEIEIKLDKFYFENIYKIASKRNRLLKEMIGQEIDLLNITTIYRAKKYFKFNKEDIPNVLVDIKYNLTNKKIGELINIDNFFQLKEILSNTMYKDVFTEEFNIEKDRYVYLNNMNKKIFNETMFNEVIIYAYMNLIKYQIKFIINTIETIRYKM